MHTVSDRQFNLRCPLSLSDFVAPETSTDLQEKTMSQLLRGSLLNIPINRATHGLLLPTSKFLSLLI